MTKYASPGVQTITIGTSGTYDITADGAQGGNSIALTNGGGFGASVGGDVYLEAGTKLEIVVGGQGGNSQASGAGGGGGSFVIETYNGTSAVDTILAVAGGGGGAGAAENFVGGGRTGANGGTGAGGGYGAGGTNGKAGHGGFEGGGGGGFTGGTGASGSGQSGQNGVDIGHKFSGGAGGIGTPFGDGGDGGVGGGGGGGAGINGIDGYSGGGGGGGGGYGGGGGGGYSGGGGGGGGSYLDTALVTHGFQTADTNSNNGSVIINAVCYRAGSRILTVDGEVAVENLKVGDLVVTASGAHRPVRWLGHRRVDCVRHPQPSAVWPIRIQAGAFAQALPARDLWVSPVHSILFDGVLIQAEKLVNGASVVQEPLESVEYWHVELESHDILLAEGLPAESYLDNGNRAAFFNNGGSYLEAHPDFKPKHWTDTCVPLVLEGPEIQKAKAQLLARAQALGYVITEETDAHIIADGRRIEALRLGEQRLAFVLPKALTTIELSCRSFVPAHIDANSPDERVLGVCVKRLQIDGDDVALDDEAWFSTGWHELERPAGDRQQRWTRARTPLPAGTRVIVIDLAGRSHCWAQPQAQAASTLCV